MSDEEYEEATPEMKQSIGQYFILSAPTGEVNQVVEDVKTLVNDPAVTSTDKLQEILRKYHTSHMTFTRSPDQSTVLVSEYGEVDGSSYLDPSTGKVLSFDHIKGKFTSETEQKQVLPDRVQEMRDAVEAAVKAYMESCYRDGKYAFAVYGTDDNQIIVCISAKNTRLSSYWTGGWQSTYTMDMSKDSTEIVGLIKVNVHYFEDGNVQLRTELNKTAKLTKTSPRDTAESICSSINKMETEFQDQLEELYVSMHSTTFKRMRRFLPVSRQPMNWVSHAHSLASEITR